MIYCYLCPLKDVCSVPKVQTEEQSLSPVLPITLNWLPDGGEMMCPLYRIIDELVKKEG